MKKFVLVMFFSMIIAVFVGFNYLLWERENREKDIKSLQDINASNSITINALNRQLENMENTLKLRNDNINKLDEENSTLKKDLERLNQDNIKINKLVEHKSEVINYLYKNDQPELITVPIKEWAECISAGDYESAYRTWYVSKEDEKESLTNFTNKYKNVIKSIKLKSIEFYSENIDKLDKKDIFLEGDIFFAVELDVKLAEDNVRSDILFSEGDNRKIFVLNYNSEEGKWHISGLMEREVP
ncbi:MAG TPA: hypothetical protein GX527_08125 [Clostridiaceae bacterium]|jgi:cellulose synthase/poly-beta-1,6-N-acetylglucosamine synthase-like glycosyltransferase|nr:hypothetical protein [Clostridiaceae bacterium]